MQVFYLDDDPQKAVEYHVDSHVVKMPVETAQILSTVLREQYGVDVGYKSVYINHPLMRWAGQSRKNFIWLWEFGIRLCTEYKYRYGRQHGSETVLREIRDVAAPLIDEFPDKPFTAPPKVVSEEYKHLDTVEAYREYYRHVKTRLHTWTYRPEPPWLKE